MFETLKYNLKNNRKSTIKKLVAWSLFSIIIIVFVFMGLTPDNQSIGQGGAAAVVNDNSISMAALAESVERMRRDPRYEQFQALGADAGRQIMQQQALSQLIEMELIRQATDKQRIWTTDAEVRDVVTSIPAFQEDGRFKRDRYMMYMQQIRKTPGEFEDEVRREQSLRRTVEMFRAALKPLPIEAEKQKALGETKANLEFVSVKADGLVAPESVKEADVAAFLAKDGSEAKVKEYYDSHKSEFSREEEVKARHILVKATAGDSASEQQALTKAKELAERAKSEDFGKLAKENSDDPGSKAKNGDLGFFPRGRMVPEFDQAAFSLPVNQVSEPIKTQFGYHLIQVQEKRPAKTFEFENVKNEIAAKLIAQERSTAAIASLETALKNQDVKAVNQFVAEHGLKWEETGAFGLDSDSVPKIGPSDELVRTAFTLSNEKPLAANLVRQGPVAYVARYKAVPAEKAKDKSADPMQNEGMMEYFQASRRSEDALKQWMDSLRKNAKISTNTEALAR